MKVQKETLLKGAALVGIGFLLGLAVGRKGSAANAMAPKGGGELPVAEVKVNGSSLGDFLYAKDPRERTDAWIAWVTASGRGARAQRVVLEWEEAGRFPVADVPPDMAVVWVAGDGTVVGSTVSPGSPTNLLVAPQPVLRALVVKKEEAPAAGGKVTLLVKREVP